MCARAPQVFIALMMATVGASQVSASTSDFGKAGPAITALFELADRKSVIDNTDPGGERPAACAGRLELQSVRYPRISKNLCRYLSLPDFGGLSL